MSLPDLVRLDGSPLPASALAGRTILFVNVASRCGLTPQYTELEALQQQLGASLDQPGDFTVIGVPCNQFAGQEPGTAEEIQTFCSTTYGVSFPLLEKQDVNGPGRSALYRYLVGSDAGGGEDIEWNFGKFVVDGEGNVVARFAPTVAPRDPALISAIQG
ncbi:MAG: glutathione peroxidase [Alphaproteobacteria bacterium]|nr:glutathione peroxidase [Alphaproteobacteria bacterium]